MSNLATLSAPLPMPQSSPSLRLISAFGVPLPFQTLYTQVHPAFLGLPCQPSAWYFLRIHATSAFGVEMALYSVSPDQEISLLRPCTNRWRDDLWNLWSKATANIRSEESIQALRYQHHFIDCMVNHGAREITPFSDLKPGTVFAPLQNWSLVATRGPGLTATINGQPYDFKPSAMCVQMDTSGPVSGTSSAPRPDLFPTPLAAIKDRLGIAVVSTRAFQGFCTDILMDMYTPPNANNFWLAMCALATKYGLVLYQIETKIPHPVTEFVNITKYYVTK